MPIDNVVEGEPIETAWGNDVADTVNAVETLGLDHSARHDAGGADALAADQAAGTASLRSLGTGATQAAAGNHAHSLDFGEVGDVAAEAFGSTALAGATGEVADAGHRHAMPAAAVTSSGLTVTADDRVLGRVSGAGGAIEELTGAQVAALIPAPDVQVFTANGTWTKPANARFVRVRCVGGGGGGGGANQPTAAGTTSAAAGGGAGGYTEKVFAASALGATEAVVVGALGAGGAAGNNGGSTGGNSTFSSAGNLLTANGGTGGAGSGVSAGAVNGGGVGGTASGGDLNATGSDGGVGICRSTNEAAAGAGGASALGGGVRAPAGNANGNTAYPYGGGGSGGRNGVSQSTARSGGNGAAGVVIVETFF